MSGAGSDAGVWGPHVLLLRLRRRRLVGVVVRDLVLQLVVGQQVQGGSLHLQLAAARAAGGEADGASAPGEGEEA